MFNGMMDPELIRIAQEQMSRMSPTELARIQQQMMSNPELIKLASENMKNMRPEDLKNAAEQLKYARTEDMVQIGEKMANATPEEIASINSQADARITYELNAAQMLKKQGNELHSQGKFSDAANKYLLAKNNLKGVPVTRGRSLQLACSLNLMSCYLKTNQYDDCVKEGSEVLVYDAENVKALYRRGQAYRELGLLQDAIYDLSKAHQASPDDETIAEVLRDADERLSKEGGEHRASKGLVIEEITEEEVSTARVESHKSSTSKQHSMAQPPKAGRSSESQTGSNLRASMVDSDQLQGLKDNPEAIRSFQDFISNVDPDTLAAMGGGGAEGVSPDMIKTASSMIGKMPPEELQKMMQMASAFQGNTYSSRPGPLPQDVSPDMLKSASEKLQKMPPEELQKMMQMASAFQGNNHSSRPGPLPQDVSPDMIKSASDMMMNMSPEELQKMMGMASSLKRNDSDTTATTSNVNRSRSNNGLNHSQATGTSAVDRNTHVGESSSSDLFPNFTADSFPSSDFSASTADLQKQMQSQMQNPAMREMLTSMIRNMDPDMMASMSERFGYKLSREDAQKAQQAMSSISPDALEKMMKWAGRLQSGVEGAKKTKNWLFGRPGMILAVCMLLLAIILHRLGYIGS